jgi:hypothetical protein
MSRLLLLSDSSGFVDVCHYEKRMSLYITIAAGPRHRNSSLVQVCSTHDHILLPQILGSLNMEGRVSKL